MADSRIPELIADLEAQACACLLSVAPVDKPTALQISKQLARHITANWGGQLVYFPKNVGGELDERDQQIYAEFNGENHQQLAKKYDLAVQQVYKIIKRVRADEMAKRQMNLLD
ncbi:Mor transcription activator family protein [Neisseriaceae bacterium B1]